VLILESTLVILIQTSSDQASVAVKKTLKILVSRLFI
jgi:hypothetical protein